MLHMQPVQHRHLQFLRYCYLSALYLSHPFVRSLLSPYKSLLDQVSVLPDHQLFLYPVRCNFHPGFHQKFPLDLHMHYHLYLHWRLHPDCRMSSHSVLRWKLLNLRMGVHPDHIHPHWSLLLFLLHLTDYHMFPNPDLPDSLNCHMDFLYLPHNQKHPWNPYHLLNLHHLLNPYHPRRSDLPRLLIPCYPDLEHLSDQSDLQDAVPQLLHQLFQNPDLHHPHCYCFRHPVHSDLLSALALPLDL